MENREFQRRLINYLKLHRFKSDRYNSNLTQAFNRVQNYLNGRPFNYENISKYTDFLHDHGFRKKWNNNALNKEITHIQKFVKYLYEEGFIKKDWARKLAKPRTFIPQHAHISKEIALELIKKATTPGKDDNALHIKSKREHFWALVFIVATGLRSNEVIQLKIKNLNIDKLEVLVPKPKGGNPKVVEIPKWPWLIKELIERKKMNTEARLFRIDRHILRLTMRRAKKMGDVPDEFLFTVHSLRAIFATDLYESGADIEVVRFLMDHKDIDTTKRYIQHSPFFKRQKLDEFESISQRYKSPNEKKEEIEKDIEKKAVILEKLTNKDGTITVTYKPK